MLKMANEGVERKEIKAAERAQKRQRKRERVKERREGAVAEKKGAKYKRGSGGDVEGEGVEGAKGEKTRLGLCFRFYKL